MTDLKPTISTLSKRIKTDVVVSVKLSTQIADIAADELNMPALATLLTQIQEQATQLARRAIYTETRRQMLDGEGLAQKLVSAGFTVEALQKEMELLDSIMGTTEEPSLIVGEDEVHLELTDEGFVNAAPLVSIEDLPIVPFKFGTSIDIVKDIPTLTENPEV